MTRAALLLSGNLRFCRDFESQTLNLQTTEPIDWYVTMWRRYHDEDTRISPNWQGKTDQDLRDWIESRIPPGHRLAQVKLLHPDSCPKQAEQYREFYANQTNLHQQFWCLEQNYLQIKPYLGQYDLVIRSRPDLGLSQALDLTALADQVGAEPRRIIMPRNERRGPWNCCDQWAAMNPRTLETYARAYRDFHQLYLRGVPYNPEYLLGAALHTWNLTWPPTDFDIDLRRQGQHVPGHFHPDFGYWL